MLHFTKLKGYKKGKQVLSKLSLHDLIINRNVDLGRLFLKLEKVAGDINLTTLRLPIDDSLLYFLGTNINTFKKVMKSLRRKIFKLCSQKKKI